MSRSRRPNKARRGSVGCGPHSMTCPICNPDILVSKRRDAVMLRSLREMRAELDELHVDVVTPLPGVG